MMFRFAVAFACIVAVSLPATADSPLNARYVAGTTPQQRPAGAPVLTKHLPPSDWRARALAGVGEPVPPSLKFLDDQGAWYTPFDRPGMPGYYDIRRLHGAIGSKAASR